MVNPLILKQSEYKSICAFSGRLYKDLAEDGKLVATPCCGRKYSRIRISEWVNTYHACPQCYSYLAHKDENFRPVVLKANDLATKAFQSTSISSDVNSGQTTDTQETYLCNEEVEPEDSDSGLSSFVNASLSRDSSYEVVGHDDNL